MSILLPFIIGLTLGLTLMFTTGWIGFLFIFPWIGLAISLGNFIRSKLKGKAKLIGRKVSIMMVLPCLLLFIPIFNKENFQLEGVFLIVFVGFLGKGFIHYLIAKIFGPLILGRGFCGWACWTAAVLDWLPINKPKIPAPEIFKHMRYIILGISILLPAFLVFVLNYDVRNNYINKHEIIWMFVGNAIYYLMAIPLAFIYSDNRFFCKNLCPVSLIMKPQTKFSLIKMKPTGNKCIECGACNKICPMDVDVMSYIKNNKKITDTECILCSDCRCVCPTKAI